MPAPPLGETADCCGKGTPFSHRMCLPILPGPTFLQCWLLLPATPFLEDSEMIDNTQVWIGIVLALVPDCNLEPTFAYCWLRLKLEYYRFRGKIENQRG